MKVKVRRGYFGAEGQTREGQILDISESRFRQLSEGIHLHHPLVDPVDVGYKMEPAPKNKALQPPANKEARGSSISFRRPVDLKAVSIGYGKEAAKGGTADPTPSPPAGGPTGEVNVVSSSELDPPRVKRRYTRRAVKPEPSSLIDPGN